ncbi:O-antigen ligase family protein [Oxynema aestuarii]|uniref:O-antigen ligase family protein n=1 Tax=Oxynema aestuarii AP17 TaxID=2064643 RepID=A0A6H1TV55_9CYAN|nr:O-antigen ligase family protein [Oxynema aestuarii]QIZ69643.1 O-antigen ligase family protein [Oxynema aestuarii AP17]
MRSWVPSAFDSSRCRHPEARLQGAWKAAQFGLLVLPMSPLVGAIALVGAMVETWKHCASEIHRRSLNRGFAALGLWLVGGTLFAEYRQAAFLGLFNFLPFFAFFAAFSALVRTPAQLRRIAWIAIVTSVPVVIIGWGQLFWGWSGPVTFWPILDWRLEATGTPPGRMASVFAYANVLASYFLITLILGLGLWFEQWRAVQVLRRRSPRAEKVRDPRDPRIVRTIDLNASEEGGIVWQRWIFLTLAVLGNAVALVLTNSRNAWAIAVLAGLAFALYHGWRALVAIVVAASSAVLGSAFAPDPVGRGLRAIVPAYFWLRLSDRLYPDRPVETLRITQWQFAWNMAGDRPLFGWGLRNFTELYRDQMGIWMGHPHNLFLMLAAETGFPATIALSTLVGWGYARGWLLLRDWPPEPPRSQPERSAGDELSDDRGIYFSYLVGFAACILFHLLDVILFDARVNILAWLLLASICGVAYYRRA